MDASVTPEVARHGIGVVARRTGLLADRIRVWERRYGAVEPVRSATGRRLYSDADVDRLRLLREVVDRGHAIGAVARLEIGRLAELAGVLPSRMSDLPPAFLPLDPQLTEEQGQAIRTAISNPVSVLTGGPGTGKTTCIQALIGAQSVESMHVPPGVTHFWKEHTWPVVQHDAPHADAAAQH